MREIEKRKKKRFRFHYRDAGYRSVVEVYRIQSSNYRSGRVYWRPSLAKCLFIRKKLPFFGSSSPSLFFLFGQRKGGRRWREGERTRGTRPRHERAHWKGADAVNLIQVLIGHGNRETRWNRKRKGIEEEKKKRLPLRGLLSPGGWP